MVLKTIELIGVPLDCGKRRRGCLMGPDAFRAAGLQDALSELGHRVNDAGNLSSGPYRELKEDHIYALQENIAWTSALRDAAREAMERALPVFLGGDHAMALGTLNGLSCYAAACQRPLFVLWLDAHTDFHTPQTTQSRHLHGTPLGYATGREGFYAFPPMKFPIPHDQIGMFGLRSVDQAEREALRDTDIHYVDMRQIDEEGIAKPLEAFLNLVKEKDGLLHVSLDTDFIDPAFAPAVGTTVPGGTTVREAHLVMEMVCDSELMTSLEVVELNPFLDERGKTARLLVDLVASALGRRVFDRPTQSY